MITFDEIRNVIKWIEEHSSFSHARLKPINALFFIPAHHFVKKSYICSTVIVSVLLTASKK